MSRQSLMASAGARVLAHPSPAPTRSPTDTVTITTGSGTYDIPRDQVKIRGATARMAQLPWETSWGR